MRSIAIVVAITLALLLSASTISSSFASPDPGRETDNVLVGPITVPSLPVDETQTQICPDGTEISIVMECPNPPSAANCPPNQLVIITQTGDCIAVPQPFTCPDGVLAPTAEQCNEPTAPIVLPPPPPLLQQQQPQPQSQLQEDTSCSIDPSQGFCHYLPQDPNKPTAAEEAEQAQQEQNEEENEGSSEGEQQEEGPSNDDNDNDGGGEGDSDSGGEEGGGGNEGNGAGDEGEEG